MVWKYQVRGLKPLSRFKLAWEFQMTATLCRFLFVWSYFVFFFYDSLKKSCQTKWRQDDMTHPYSCHLCQLKTQKKRALSCLWVLTFLTRMAVNKHESNRGSHRLTLLSWGLLAVLVHLSHLLCCRGEKKTKHIFAQYQFIHFRTLLNSADFVFQARTKVLLNLFELVSDVAVP